MCIFICNLVYSYENVMTKIQNYYNELDGIKIYISDALYLYNYYGIIFSINHFLRSLNSRKHSLIRLAATSGSLSVGLTLKLMLT